MTFQVIMFFVSLAAMIIIIICSVIICKYNDQKVGLCKYNKETKKWGRKIKAIHKSGVEYIFDSVKECSKVLGIRDSAIGMVRRGERTHCHRYKFEML